MEVTRKVMTKIDREAREGVRSGESRAVDRGASLQRISPVIFDGRPTSAERQRRGFAPAFRMTSRIRSVTVPGGSSDAQRTAPESPLANSVSAIPPNAPNC